MLETLSAPVGEDGSSSTGFLRAGSSERRRIPAKDRVMLSTWQKWIMYGQFPYKLVLHVVLVFLTTWQILFFNGQDAAYRRAAHRNWYYYFFPKEFDFEARNFYLYTVDETVDSLSRAVLNYQKIVLTSVDQLVHPTKPEFCFDDDHCSDGLLEVVRFDPDFVIGHVGKISERYWIRKDDYGPIDRRKRSAKEIAEYLQSLLHMNLSYRLEARGPDGSGRECLVWEIRLEYHFEQRGQIELLLHSNVVMSCDDEVPGWSLFSSQVHVVNITIVFFSVWSSALSFRSLFSSYKLLRRAERRYRGEIDQSAPNSPMIESSWTPLLDEGASSSSSTPLLSSENAPLSGAPTRPTTPGLQEPTISKFSTRDKLLFFNLWNLLTLCAAFLNITGALLCLMNNQRYSPSKFHKKLFCGMGCALLWTNSISFLAHKPSYYTVVLTLRRALPRVARFLVGVIPIFLGYALFGLLYFGDHSERFGSFGVSLFTLFAVLNGDVIRETFTDLVSIYPMLSQVYLYSFICLFTFVVLNVFIAIVEESFFSTRSKARSMELFVQRVRREEEVQRRASEDGDGTGAVATSTSASRNAAFGSASPKLRPVRSQSFEWGKDNDDDEEHRKLKWFRRLLHDLEENSS